MPEWNLVTAKETQQAQASSSRLGLSKLTAVHCLVLAVLLASQFGCTKLRNGAMDRNILRSGDTVPSQDSRPASPPAASAPRFSNNPGAALLELNEVYEEFEGTSFDQSNPQEVELNQELEDNNSFQSPTTQAKIIEVSEESFETADRGITLVAIQPPAPSIKDSFEVTDAVEARPTATRERVLLGGVPLDEIEPINPAKIISQCDHVACDCMKEKLKPVLPFAQPVQPPIQSQAPPSELVSQPLAPIMFDETTREVEEFDQQQTEQNMLRLVAQHAAETVAPIEEKIETTIVPEQNDFVNTEEIKIEFHPTVDPNLGRVQKSVPGCSDCESPACAGDCVKTNRRQSENQLRPIVMSEPIPLEVVGTAVTEVPLQKELPQQRAPIAIKGEFVTQAIVAPVDRVDYTEFTTQDWIEIFGPPPAPVKALTTTRDRRSDFQPDVAVIPPTVEEEPGQVANEFQMSQSNDFAPNDVVIDLNGVELVDAEVAAEAAKWEPPMHANFSPIPNGDRSLPHEADANSLALEKAALRGASSPFPVVDTRVEIPAKPKVVVEIVDNTVPWSVKLAETIDNVRRQRNAESDPMARNGIEVNLRLLEVLQRQMVTVEENRHSMPNGELQYWQHQLDAIALMLPSTDNGVSDFDRHNTAYETLEHLRKAVERLESIAELKVLSGRFCTEISGFGKYKPFANTVFTSGQKTLIYCEVENYTSTSRAMNSEQTYHTRLRGSYVIYDQQGRAVQQSEYPVVEDIARKKRRDFYMYFPIQIGDLRAGNYRLELMVEDLGSNKSAALKPGMAFQVR